MSEAGLRHRDHRFGRLNIDVDGRQARAIFEKALASFQLFDLGADFRDLSLHFERIFDLVRLAHDLEKLNFECFLSFDSRFEIDEVFGDVLARHLFCRRVAGKLLDLVEGGAELIRWNSDHELDVERPLPRIVALALFCFRSNDKPAVRLGNGGHAVLRVGS